MKLQLVFCAAFAAAVLLCFLPVVSAQSPAPSAVPDKELSNDSDLDMTGSPDPLQNLRWDGLGGTMDSPNDYSGSGPPPSDPDQVDALANSRDHLFTQLLNNQAAMVVSQRMRTDLFFHNTNGATGTWATTPQVSTSPVLTDLDAVELWSGAEGQMPAVPDDALHYSYFGDHIPPVPPGPPAVPVSVFFYERSSLLSFTYVPFAETQAALAAFLMIDPGQVDMFEPDIDALMVQDTEEISFGQVPTWNDGDTIIFSLRPDSNFGLDGGELFVWQRGASVNYLTHGGRLWNTANPVGTIFGSGIEDINALEAIVPEPTSTSMWLAGVLLIAFWRRILENT